MGEYDRDSRGGGWTRQDILRHRAKMRAQWLASLSNGRRRFKRSH